MRNSNTSAKVWRRKVLGALKLPPKSRENLRGKKVLLVDDVFTTGVTLGACARAETGRGGKVDVLSLARVVRPG